MKVLLIQQDLGVREYDYPLFPLGLTYIAAAISEHEVRIFDPNFFPVSQANEALTKRLNEFLPEVVGISIRNIDTTNFRNRLVHFKTVPPMVQLIRSISPSVKIIAGGTGFSMFPEIIMRKVPEIDFGIYLEGEESTPELLANLDKPWMVNGVYYREKGKVLFSGPRLMPDYSRMFWPATDPEIINVRDYYGPSYNIVGIQTKRGCALKCAYCSYPALNGSRVRMRPPNDVVDQIEHLVRVYGLKRFTFVDSVFNSPTQHAVDICDEMIRRKLDVEFGVWCNIQGITEEFLRKLKEAGAVQIDFSPDAATDKGLAALRKGFTEKEIEKTIRMASKVKGVGFGFGFFTSLPGYNLTDVLKTLLMPFRIQLALPSRGGGAVWYIRIEPDTLIREIAVREGFISADDELFPEDEDDLVRMFYRPSSQRRLTFITDVYGFIFGNVLKPAAIMFFRFLAKLRGRRSVYDRKSGISSRQ